MLKKNNKFKEYVLRRHVIQKLSISKKFKNKN